MIRVKEAVIVEGKYDKIRLENFIDGLILTTEGFGIFKNKEKQMLIRRLAAERGILILTDSDGAGFVIRNFLKGCIPKEKVFHAYIPDIFGKERRKGKASKEGKLGVEGISDDILKNAIALSGAHCTVDDSNVRLQNEITKADMFALGLSGGEYSARKREVLKKKLSLPENMTANSLMQILGCLMTKEELENFCEELFGNGDNTDD